MTPNFQLPINTRLADVNFAIQYKLIEEGNLTTSSHTQALSSAIVNIIKRARDEKKADDLDTSVARFFNEHGKELMAKPATKAKAVGIPLASRIDAYLEKYELFDRFQRAVEVSPLQHMWLASYIPRFFVENPVDGLETVISNDEYDDHAPTINTLIFSVPHVKSVCMEAGYIKAPMKMRVAVAKGDLTPVNKLREMLAFFQLNCSKADRVKFADGIVQYEITINLSGVDRDFHKSSEKALGDLKALYNTTAVEKPKYTFYAEEEPFSELGFKNLKDVQSFLDLINKSIIALDANEVPTSLYLRSTLSLISIRTKDGPIDLSRFKLPITLIH